MKKLTHIDLFSGIGGFALAAKWNGLETIQFCEIDSFCTKTLKRNFPGVPIHGDIRELHWPPSDAERIGRTGSEAVLQDKRDDLGEDHKPTIEDYDDRKGNAGNEGGKDATTADSDSNEYRRGFGPLEEQTKSGAAEESKSRGPADRFECGNTDDRRGVENGTGREDATDANGRRCDNESECGATSGKRQADWSGGSDQDQPEGSDGTGKPSAKPFLLTGGFPCQPFSCAGQRRGTADTRFLFPELLRVIREARPRWIILENVTGLLSILEPEGLSDLEIKAVQLFNENEDEPRTKIIDRVHERVIARIIRDIEQIGYVFPRLADGTPIILCLPAAGVNAPHRRDRLWITGYADSAPKSTIRAFCGREDSEPDGSGGRAATYSDGRDGESCDIYRLGEGKQGGIQTPCPGGYCKRGSTFNATDSDRGHGEECRTEQKMLREQDGEASAGLGDGDDHASDANDSGCRASDGRVDGNRQKVVQDGDESQLKRCGCNDHASDTTDDRKSRSCLKEGCKCGKRVRNVPIERSDSWDEPWIEVASRLCRVDDGLPHLVDRAHRLKALGNAIVPAVASEVIKAILQAEKLWEVENA